MKWLLLCAAVLTGVSAVGCRANGRQELLERDLRFQEDRINHLQGHVTDYRQQLDCALAENDALRSELARLKSGTGTSPQGSLPIVRPAAPFRAPQILPPGGLQPEGQMPMPPSGRGQPNLQRTPPGIPTEIPVGPPKVELPPGASSDAGEPARERQVFGPITQLTLNRQLTGGYDNDQQSGDDGVIVCLEPRTADGRLAELLGPLSIVVMDPALPGEAARVARWDLAADEVAARARRSPRGAGLQLELPWPTAAPRHRELKLFVRHSMADGRKLDVDQDIEIIRPGEHVRRWTRSARQARVRTVPIAEPAQPQRDLAGTSPAADAAADLPTEERQLPADAMAQRPQWTPYR
jgi:hypothetical protein